MNSYERDRAVEQLHILELVEKALDRRDEVFAIMDSSSSAEEAQERVRVLFEVEDHHSSRAILDLTVSRWTLGERERIHAEVAHLRDLLRGQP